MRTWHKSLPMKKLHEELGLYNGVWSTQMDRYWESSDGYTVSSRQIRTVVGTIEHLAIEKIGGDIPWAVKQEIKDELFGSRAVAIEVYPAKKNLVDVADIYHLWVLPKDYQLPFGIHPTRDPQGLLCNVGTISIWMMSWHGTTARSGKQYTPNRAMTSSSLGEVFIFDMILGPTRFLPQHRL